MEAPTWKKYTPLLVGLGLAAAVWAIYGPVLHFPFVDYDDQSYVYENSALQGGSSGQFVRWALLETHAANWHPLTWFSHKLDWLLFGSWAGGHHGTSILIHIANAILFFWLLRLSTGRWKRAPSRLFFSPFIL